MLVGRLICYFVGHHPDDLHLIPIGVNADGDFVSYEHLNCRRCGCDIEVYNVAGPLPVWADER